MNKRNIFTIILALALSAALLAGCVQDSPAPPSSSPVSQGQATGRDISGTARSITDMKGRVVELPEKIERVVVLDAADCEIFYALGAEEMLVGRGEYCDYPEEIMSLPSVQSGSATNIEQVLALEPQLIIMGMMNQTIDQVEAFANAGIAVVVTNPQNIDDVYAGIELIGEVIEKPNEAAALVGDMRGAFEELSGAVTAAGGGTVYFEVSPLEWGLWTAGRGTFMDELATMLGLENIFSDVDGWAEVSQEQVIERDPDYIVTIAMYYGEGPTPSEEIVGRDGWQGMKAIKSGAVLLMDADEISRPGPRLGDAARTLYDFVYGG